MAMMSRSEYFPCHHTYSFSRPRTEQIEDLGQEYEDICTAFTNYIITQFIGLLSNLNEHVLRMKTNLPMHGMHYYRMQTKQLHEYWRTSRSVFYLALRMTSRILHCLQASSRDLFINMTSVLQVPDFWLALKDANPNSISVIKKFKLL